VGAQRLDARDLGGEQAALGVEHVELVRRPAEPALFELSRHRDQPLPGCREVLAGGAAPPGIRASPSVRKDPPGDEQPFFVLGTKLRQRLEFLLL